MPPPPDRLRAAQVARQVLARHDVSASVRTEFWSSLEEEWRDVTDEPSADPVAERRAAGREMSRKSAFPPGRCGSKCGHTAMWSRWPGILPPRDGGYAGAAGTCSSGRTAKTTLRAWSGSSPVTAALMRRLPSGSGGSAIATCCLTPPAPRSSVGAASARPGLHRRDIRRQPTLRAAVSAQSQLSRPADSQVIAPHHRLHPNLVPSVGENAGLCLTPTNASWANPIPVGPLRTSVMSNSDKRNHPALARKLQAYLRWRNAQGSLPRRAGRPAPRARPHPQRTPATLGPPKPKAA